MTINDPLVQVFAVALGVLTVAICPTARHHRSTIAPSRATEREAAYNWSDANRLCRDAERAALFSAIGCNRVQQENAGAQKIRTPTNATIELNHIEKPAICDGSKSREEKHRNSEFGSHLNFCGVVIMVPQSGTKSALLIHHTASAVLPIKQARV
jgi:hypothetical protein